ncbi:MAG: O-antigen ligase family protein [Armatimonadota bacterium]
MIGRLSGAIDRREAAKKAVGAVFTVGGILLIGYILSSMIIKLDVYFVIVVGIIVLVSIILSRWFALGIVLFALIAPFNTGNSPAVLGAEASYRAGVMPSQLGLVFLCAFWGITRFFGSGIKLAKSRLNLPAAVFLGVAVASMISSYFIWDDGVHRYDKQLLYQVSEIGIWALCVAAFFLAASSMKDKRWIGALYWPVAIIGIYATFFQVTGLEWPWSITRSTFITAFAAILTTARVLFGKESAGGKIGLAVLLGIFLLGSFWSRSWVSGWLTASLGITMVVLFYSRKMFAVTAVILLLAIAVQPAAMNTVYSESRSEGDMDRFDLWADAAKMASSVNPILGIGPADYFAYSKKYGSVWYGNTTYTTAHSDYAQMIAELGLFGIAAFIWLVVAGIRTGIDTVRKGPKELKWLTVSATAIFAAIAITSLVGDYLLPSRVNGGIWSFSSSVFPWLLLGAAVAAAQPGEEDYGEEAEV